ncbi:DUF6777 domain-containing protein [Streptomyces sp. NPDC093089]|uniref:DUF6777 domain-containing protein n=1 Tax=Streptomyces sp. NPDC093089 TaxID=3366024 RepID=UPI0038020C76
MRTPLHRTRRTAADRTALPSADRANPTATNCVNPTAADRTAPAATDHANRVTAASGAASTAPAPGAAPVVRARRAAPPAAARSAAAALASALLLAGCSSAAEDAGEAGEQARAALSQDIVLQPVGAGGPDPFTASTARITRLATAPDRGPGDGSGRLREVAGSTPGLYGGTRAEASCDVEQQAAFLAADQGKTRAFAEAAGIPEANVGDWLRGLTPVVLRADARVTNHGYREGRATAFQSVLQTGTAVLVDQYGSPRVRCACGNPLRSPVAVKEGVHQGDPWDGFDPDRVIVVRPTSTVVTSLVIVNAADSSWIERLTGSDGAEDRKPDVEPACDPDACALADPATPDPSSPDGRTSPDPASPAPVPPRPVPSTPAPDPSGTGGTGTGSEPPVPPSEPYPDPYTDPGTESSPDPYADPRTDPYPDPQDAPHADPPLEPPTAPVPDGEMPQEDVFPAGAVPDRPETFEG